MGQDSAVHVPCIGFTASKAEHLTRMALVWQRSPEGCLQNCKHVLANPSKGYLSSQSEIWTQGWLVDQLFLWWPHCWCYLFGTQSCSTKI